jgi:hypothetical protein
LQANFTSAPQALRTRPGDGKMIGSIPASYRKWALAALFCLTGVFTAADVAQAQTDQGPVVDFNLFSAKNLVVGSTIKVDAEFAEKHDMDVPAPFSVIIPTSEDFFTAARFGPRGDAYMKISFATNEKQLIDNLRFVTMTVPLVEAEERLKLTAKMLAGQGLATAVRGYGNAQRKGIRRIRIGKYDAVEVVGSYTDSELGLMFVRLVGIPNPNSKFSIFAVINVVAGQTKIESADDLSSKTRSGRSLTTFRYLN